MHGTNLCTWNSLLACLFLNPMRTQSKMEREKSRSILSFQLGVIVEGEWCRVSAALRIPQLFNGMQYALPDWLFYSRC